MRLKSISYADHPGESREWRIHDFVLGDANLVVGLNASGKSRTLAAIGNLAWLISAKIKLGFRTADSDCTAEFEDAGRALSYTMQCRQGKVTKEVFIEDGRERMTRGEGGAGRIDSVKDNKTVEFQTPETELAIVARRDSIQHGFFDPLHLWAASVYRYEFGSQLGKHLITVEVPNSKYQLDPRNQDEVMNIFTAGEALFEDKFKESIKRDMAKLDYPLDKIGAVAPTAFPISHLPGPAKYLYVKEHDLDCITEQWEMSQGMFRALSIIIQLTYSQMTAKPACVIIDDIGEGLDFGRSCALIDLLMEKAKVAGVQLLMSTNDRFVMNKVPLEVWTVLRRSKGRAIVNNYVNSKKLFDAFEYTGLNNFDFLATDFVGEDLEKADGIAGASHQ